MDAFAEYIFKQIPGTHFGYGQSSVFNLAECTVLIDGYTNYINATKLCAEKLGTYMRSASTATKMAQYQTYLRGAKKQAEEHDKEQSICATICTIPMIIHKTQVAGKIISSTTADSDDDVILTYGITRAHLAGSKLTATIMNEVIGTYVHPAIAIDFIRYFNFPFFIHSNHILSRHIHKENIITHAETLLRSSDRMTDPNIATLARDVLNDMQEELRIYGEEFDELLYAGAKLDIEGNALSASNAAADARLGRLNLSIDCQIEDNKTARNVDIDKMTPVAVTNLFTDIPSLICRHGHKLNQAQVEVSIQYLKACKAASLKVYHKDIIQSYQQALTHLISKYDSLCTEKELLTDIDNIHVYCKTHNNKFARLCEQLKQLV